MNTPGLHADGGGLYLQVGKSGSKSWIFRFTRNKVTRDMGLGPLNTVSLSDARDQALECRKVVRDGYDPIDIRKSERARRAIETAAVMTFKECADAYISTHSSAWKNIKHVSQWPNSLAMYVHPTIGHLPVDAVDTGLVMKILEPIWLTKTETASRVRQRMETILDWAAARGYRSRENPARLKGHLDKLLPSRSKVAKVKHHAALPFDQLGDFMDSLRQQDSISALGLEFLILTAARTGEVRGATWDEIDIERAEWVVPAARMKAGREHRVPLSSAAMQIVQKLAELRVSEYLLPGQKTNMPLSDMAFLQLRKRMGRGDITPHGFRSTFRDWVSERTPFPREVAEMALAHSIDNKVEAAYRRGDLFEKRRQLMDEWATFCAA